MGLYPGCADPAPANGTCCLAGITRLDGTGTQFSRTHTRQHAEQTQPHPHSHRDIYAYADINLHAHTDQHAHTHGNFYASPHRYSLANGSSHRGTC